MKKHLTLLCICICAVLLFAGCAETHTHDYDWYANAESHWQKCSCGQQSEITAHAINEAGTCAVCNSDIYSNDDGTFSIYTYDSKNTLVRQADYDADGNRTYELRSDIEYYDDGNIKTVKDYENDVLISECTYLPCVDAVDAEVYLAEAIYYYEDGEKEVVLYNEDSNLLSVTYYDALGSVSSVERYEYEYDADGNCIKQTTYVDGVINREIFYKADSEGYFYEYRQVYYNEKGEVVEEYNFNANGDIK